MSPIDVVLPVLDEAAVVASVVGAMPTGYRPIVVDNGSTDGSAAIARRAGARVVREPRRGFGAACHAGLLAATGDVVCFMDCDGSLDPADLPAVAGPVLDGSVDLMLAARRPEPGAWPWHLRAGNALLAGLMRRRTGAPLTDLGPMRAGRRLDLLGLGLRDRRFGYPLEMVIRASTAGWLIGETTVPYAARHGRSKVTGTMRGTVRTVRDMRAVWTAAG